jgi:adenine deaminase
MILRSNLVDIHKNRIYPAEITLINGVIGSIKPTEERVDHYILPGFIDAHIHIESSMVTPVAFSEVAVRHGTIGLVSDPHEIANVLGKEGVGFMVHNAQATPMKILFGAPSCVPATKFESAGAIISDKDIEELLQSGKVGFLSEVMNYPGVIQKEFEILRKIAVAVKQGVPIDGHAPGLRGEELVEYVRAGISTDHECLSFEEAAEKISLGMKVLIREGSGAKNFNTLIPLLKEFPEKIMFCTDDLHPDDLLKGHINILVKRAVKMGYDLFDVIRAAGMNAAEHYGIDVGMLREGDKADFILVDSLISWNVLKTYINGRAVYENGTVNIEYYNREAPNRFFINKIKLDELVVKANRNYLRVIRAIDGDLVTEEIKAKALVMDGNVVADIKNDILKIAVVNRYHQAVPATGFINGFKLKKGAIATSIGHDCHNIICIGTSDKDMAESINWLVENKGGIVVHDGKNLFGLALEIAGLMTTGNVKYAAGKYKELTSIARKIGSEMQAPFMTLSFMALLVIPELKMSDMGLFSGKSFSFVSKFFDQDEQ